MQERGYCLVSQQIRAKAIEGGIIIPGASLSLDDKGRFKDASLEKRVQPSSLEPVIGDEAFSLDIEEQAVFNPGALQVYRALLQLPGRQRQRFSMEGGFELIAGFTYLIPLEERVIPGEGERIKSSPKSSTGRLLPITRMLADYTPTFDEIHHKNTPDTDKNKRNHALQMWLLVKPTAFNLISHPGLTLNQLRFFSGQNASLTQSEMAEEFKKNPMLYVYKRGKLVPANPVITDDGMRIDLDLTGERTYGIAALRARKNPQPIDLSKTGFYKAEEYFEPVLNRRGEVKFHGGERYLIASKGVLHVPPHLSAELRRYHGLGVVRAMWDEAGFVDNDFRGDVVFEVTPMESGGMALKSNAEIPATNVEFFRTSEDPDKMYGDKIGSNYQNQSGPRVSKHFIPFDFAYAARNYQKLRRNVLVHDAKVLLGFRRRKKGFEPLTPKNRQSIESLLEEIEKRAFFHSRYDCEDDTLVLQAVPYVLVFSPDRKVFTYVRAKKIEYYGDKRLFGKHSIGLGGHIRKSDRPHYIRECIAREVTREEVEIRGEYSEPKLAGTLMAYNKPVDRVHLGLIYVIHALGEVVAIEPSITSFGMQPIRKIVRSNPRYWETWSRILRKHLPALYRL